MCAYPLNFSATCTTFISNLKKFTPYLVFLISLTLKKANFRIFDRMLWVNVDVSDNPQFYSLK